MDTPQTLRAPVGAVRSRLAGQVCPICGSTGQWLYHPSDPPIHNNPKSDLRECRCVGGGVLLSWPWASEQEYEAWYADPTAYHEDEQTANGQRPFAEMQADHEIAAWSRLKTLTTIYPQLTGKRLLDVGCGDGSFVMAAHDTGMQAYGIEPNARLLDCAHYDIRGFLDVGTWRDIDSHGFGFDCICLHDVFEHLTRPSECLHHLRKFMGTDARLVIEMPEWDSPAQRAARLGWKHIRPRQHVCLYSFDAAVKIFEESGYRLDAFWRPLGGKLGKATWVLREQMH